MKLDILESRIGIKFKAEDLLKEALTHRSYINENPRWGKSHNERLEYLGDAVLELIITEYLFTTYPTYEEGIKVLPPDINASFENFTVDVSASNMIRFGLLAVKNVGANIVSFIIQERSRGGPFVDLANFLLKIQHRDLNKKSLEAFIKCGAFDSLGTERGQTLDNIEELLRFNQAAKKMGGSNQHSLFGAGAMPISLRLKPGKAADKSLALSWEKELLGLYITDHPFNAYLPKVRDYVKPIKDVMKLSPVERGPRLRLAGIISGVQKIFTKRGDPMLFVTLEDLENKMEILVFSDTLTKYPLAWQENKAVMVNGRLSWRGDEPKLICDDVKEL